VCVPTAGSGAAMGLEEADSPSRDPISASCYFCCPSVSSESRLPAASAQDLAFQSGAGADCAH
jgi:hypothetical protein